MLEYSGKEVSGKHFSLQNGQRIKCYRSDRIY